MQTLCAGEPVYGRGMYEVISCWDAVDLNDGALSRHLEREFARVFAATPKYVECLGQPELGPSATLLEGDVVEAVRQLQGTAYAWAPRRSLVGDTYTDRPDRHI